MTWQDEIIKRDREPLAPIFKNTTMEIKYKVTCRHAIHYGITKTREDKNKFNEVFYTFSEAKQYLLGELRRRKNEYQSAINDINTMKKEDCEDY